MLERFIYWGLLKTDFAPPIQQALMDQWDAYKKQGLLYTASVFQWEQKLFIYYERYNENIDIELLASSLKEYLEPIPGLHGVSPWVRMNDIYHYSKPVSDTHWERKHAPDRVNGKIACLRPEMVSSYIFYHYQLQEEKIQCGNKYGIITLSENLLFFYEEFPLTYEELPYPLALNTNNTPPNWHEVMEPHFYKWNDGKLWSDIENICRI